MEIKDIFDVIKEAERSAQEREKNLKMSKKIKTKEKNKQGKHYRRNFHWEK